MQHSSHKVRPEGAIEFFCLCQIRTLSSLQIESVPIPDEDSCSKIVSLDLQESRRWQTHQQPVILSPLVLRETCPLQRTRICITSTPSRYIQASFEKAHWKLEPLLLSDSKKDLACATLRSIALNYIARRSPTPPPKALLQAINNLKRRDDIVITKPDKGSGVVVMDKADYLRLLCDASVCDSTKFIRCMQHWASKSALETSQALSSLARKREWTQHQSTQHLS